MDYNSILTQLADRDKLSQSQSFWDDYVKLSNAIIENLNANNQLKNEVPQLQSKVEQLTNEINSNSQSAQLKREINGVQQSISELKEQYELEETNMKLIAEEFTHSRNEKDSIEKEVKEFEDKNTKLKENAKLLEEEKNAKLKEVLFRREGLTGMQKRYTDLMNHREQITMELLKSKEIEMNLRNEDYVKSDAPEVDTSKFKVEIPNVKSSNSPENASTHEEYIFNQNFIKNLQPEAHPTKQSGTITSLCFANTQPLFASGSEDNSVIVIRADSNSKIAALNDSSKTIMSIKFSPSDKFLMAASYDGSVRFYKIPDFRFVICNSDNRECVNDAVFITDDKFVTVCRNQSIKLFDIQRSAPVNTIISSSTPNSIIPLQGESLVVTGHYDGYVRGYDLRSSQHVFEVKAHKQHVIQVCGRQGASKIMSISCDKTIASIDLKETAVAGSVNFHRAGLPSEKIQMAMVDGDAIIGSTTGEIYEYDLSNFKLRGTSKAHEHPVYCVAASQTYGLLATGDRDGIVKFWNSKSANKYSS